MRHRYFTALLFLCICSPGYADDVTLELGKAISQEISGDQKLSYQVVLSEGKFAKVVARQLDVDVEARLFGPDDDAIGSYDSAHTNSGEEKIEWVGKVAGKYRLTLDKVYPGLPAGRFEIELLEARPAGEKERSLDDARRDLVQARKSFGAGKYDDAIQFGEKCLKLREQFLGHDDLEIASTLMPLAVYYRNADNYPKAEELYLRALAIREKTLGRDHPDVAALLSNLGYLYYNLNDYDKAETLYRRALAIQEKSLGPTHPMVGTTLNNMGLVRWQKHDYKKAKDYYERALAINEKTVGPESFDVAISTHNLGIVYKESGDYLKGEEYYRRALAVWEKTQGEEGPMVALASESLGILFRDKGAYDKAEPFLKRALEIEEKTEGPYHPDVANTLVILGQMYEAMGDIARANEFESRANSIEEKVISLNLTIGSERQKVAYFTQMVREEERRISLHAQSAPEDASARDLAATVILQRKGRILDAMSDTLAALQRRSNREDDELLAQLNDTTAALSRLVLEGPEDQTRSEYEKKLHDLEAKRETLENDVSRRSMGLYQPSQPVTLLAVRAEIPENAALVEFAVYHHSHPKLPLERQTPGPSYYIAYVIRRNGEVQWKELGQTKSIDARVNLFRAALREPLRDDVKKLGRSLDADIMQPIRLLVGDATRLLISPDGELNLIPFGALVDEQNRYLIERYEINYLSSGRDLLRMRVPRENKSGDLVLANPLFGQPTAAEKTRRGVSGSELSDVHFEPLPGTAIEANTIKSLFEEATVLSGPNATESSLKQAQAPRILHIATHGFFLRDEAIADQSGQPSAPASSKTKNPLLRSGLAFAGANLRPNSGDDGILTALEASGLNLWGTKLVTLSACDTGLGEIKNGEGVFGLRRAFVLSGAETLIMTLWPINDVSSPEMMTGYYKGLREGLGRGEALRDIQLKLLKTKSLQHPYYWAGFIQSGEWANLAGDRN